MRLSAIGDVCHAVAMVQAIQAERPDIQITWVIGKVEFQLLQGLEGVEFVVFDKKQGRKARNQLKQQLSAVSFDVLLMMQVALRANWVSQVIRAKYRVGFDRDRSKELHSWFINHRIAPQKHAHVLQGFMGFAQAIGIKTPSKPHWKMPVSEQDYQHVESLINVSQPYVVIAPAASKRERCWSIENYAATADFVAQRGYQVVLCGAPAPLDTELATGIAQNSDHRVVNLVGKTTLKQLLVVLEKAALVIAPDTGPTHMATTVGTPVIGLYAHSNPRRTGPYMNLPQVISVYEEIIQQQTGKQWHDLPWGKRAKGADLMQRITQQAVCQQVMSCLPESKD